MDYIDLRYKPGKNDVVLEYYVEPNGMSIEKCCEHLAGESSIGTWTKISTMNPKIARELKPNVFSISRKTGEVKIAYDKKLFEPGNMPGILSSVAGNIYGMRAVRNLRLQDIHFPKAIIQSFKGPQFGIEGIRKLTGVSKRPLVGTIVKPKVGLTAKQHAKVAYESWVGGLDLVKDDENLTSMGFNNFYDRIRETLKMKRRAERETGEKKLYMANTTSETLEMLKRADYVKRQKGEYVMIDILTAGFSALQSLRNHTQKTKQLIHAHRAMHAALTRNPRHGMSMTAIAKISRLIGVDQLHIGTAHIGKMDGSAGEALDIEYAIEKRYFEGKTAFHSLKQDWYDIKPVMAVASGGLHPGMSEQLFDRMGTNIIAQFGGGCHGHPGGTRAGAKAIRQSVDAYMQGISLQDYAKNHKEIQQAIKRWGLPK